MCVLVALYLLISRLLNRKWVLHFSRKFPRAVHFITSLFTTPPARGGVLLFESVKMIITNKYPVVGVDVDTGGLQRRCGNSVSVGLPHCKLLKFITRCLLSGSKGCDAMRCHRTDARPT